VIAVPFIELNHILAAGTAQFSDATRRCQLDLAQPQTLQKLTAGFQSWLQIMAHSLMRCC
jgi:hypothetical protein